MRSKPDPVEQPKRTAHYDCAMYIAEMLHNTNSIETVLSVNILLPPDQHHCSDEAKWRLGEPDIFPNNSFLNRSITPFAGHVEATRLPRQEV